MPKINVYLPQWLADEVRATDVAVSEICQHALAAALGRKTLVPKTDAPSTDWLRQSADERAQDLERGAAAIRYALAPSTTVPVSIKPIGAATALAVLKTADRSLLEWESRAQAVTGYAAALEVAEELGASKSVITLLKAKLAEAQAALDGVEISDQFGSRDQILDLIAELTERAHPRAPR